MGETTIVNIRNYHGPQYIYCGRGSPFGNPYVIGQDGTREEVCAAFQFYFDYRIQSDPEWRKLVMDLKGKVLGCYCSPLQCHCETYVEFLED